MATPSSFDALAFLRRHVWSVSLSTFSALCFGQLASEVSENELTHFDHAMAVSVVHFRGGPDRLMLTLTSLGSGDALTLLTAAVAVALILYGRRREALYLVFCAVGSWLLNLGMKELFQRARPDVSYLIKMPSSFSFPSGHAMCSAGIFASLAILARVLGGPKVWAYGLVALCFFLMMGIGLSRVYFGVHFASDVLGGQLASTALVSALTGWFYPRLLPGEHSTTTPVIESAPD
ncbi:MAG TPA: phosphatase PAP2 family protein [Polyangiaceae bacterium]|nr:phosphatase PAP2 family protein [Polyangiaceae bacterium]